MITYERADLKMESLKKLDMALYGDTKGEIRKFIIRELEKHLFDISIDCPEEYLMKIQDENENENIDRDGIFTLLFYEIKKIKNLFYLIIITLQENWNFFLKKKDKINFIKKKTLHTAIINDVKIRKIFGSLFMSGNLINLLEFLSIYFRTK